jgi:hypothetical protein
MDPDIHAPLLDETSVYGAAARNENISKQMKGVALCPLPALPS